MRLWIVLLVMLSFSTAHAEANPTAMRITGAIFTAIAAGLGVVSMSFFLASRSCPDSGDCGVAMLFTGGTFAVGALAAAGVGVPLLAVGEHRLGRQTQISLAPAFSPGGAGAALRLTW